MENKKNETFSPRVVLILDFCSLGVELVEKFGNLGVDLFVVSKNLKKWREKISEGKTVKLLGYWQKKEILDIYPDYLVCVETSNIKNRHFLNSAKMYLAGAILRNSSAKTLLVFPILTFFPADQVLKALREWLGFEKSSSVAVVFVGDTPLLLEGDESWYFNVVLKRLKKTKRIDFLPTTFSFFPISCQELAMLLIKSLFSLKSYGKVSAILGRRLLARDLVRILKKVDGELTFSWKKKIDLPQIPDVEFRIYSGAQVKELILRAYSLIPESGRFAGIKGILRKIKNTTTPGALGLQKNRVFALVFTILIFPMISLSLAYISLIFAQRAFTQNLFWFAGFWLKSAAFTSSLSSSSSRVISKSLILEAPYKRLAGIATLFEKKVESLQRLKKIADLGISLFEGIKSDSSIDPLKLSKEIGFELDNLYKDLEVLESEVGEGESLSSKVARILVGKIRLPLDKDEIPQISRVFSFSPDILGKGGKKRYLIIFQDSSSLRPTGGAIRSFAFVTFLNGKVLETSFYDASLLDGNPKGVIGAPKPLRDYFGDGAWFLRDANWDPDFSFSSQDLGRFIDMNLDLEVDGVLGIDSEFIREALRIIGGLEVDGQKLTDENFFDIVLVQDEKYPKTENRLFFHLLENLFVAFSGAKKSERLEFLKLVVRSFQQKNLLIFLRKTEVGAIFNSLGWDGALKAAECVNCFRDFIGLVEASPGKNSNRMLREAELSVFVEEGLIKRIFTVFFENPTDQIYKAYLRVVVPAENGFSQAELVSNKGPEKKNLQVYGLREFKEGGVFFEVGPGQSKVVRFYWEGGWQFTETLNYNLLIRKQPGVPRYPLLLKFYFPKEIQASDINLDNLTKEAEFVYNTVLSQDASLGLSLSHQ